MRALNRVEASAIRVNADEVTYNLHILVRFDLELALLRGQLEVADLPENPTDEQLARAIGMTGFERLPADVRARYHKTLAERLLGSSDWAGALAAFKGA